MKISYNWLQSYLPETIAVEKLGKILTSIGLEVESIEEVNSHPNGLKGLFVGEVLSCEQHPNADKLKITTVDIGDNTPLQIVCGASNVAVGQKVIVATVGTTIYPSNGEPLTMKVAKIRGTESYGMICAEDEIGLGNGHEGILVLPAATKIGTTAAAYFNVTNDYVIEIGITANRIDAMSHLGVARDVCAWLCHAFSKSYKVIQPQMEGVFADKPISEVSVTIHDEDACQRYAGVVLHNLQVKPSPEWMQQRLKAIGVRPINNIVDVTNYVLHETGQPLHAFDLQKIDGKEIHVRLAKEGASFVTLDEKERKLTAHDIMIENKQEGMCIGGVFGGIKSGVTENTTSIFLEAAWFNPSYIRKTSMHHELRTDAAIRFEKQTDISMVPIALKRAISLLKEVSEGVSYTQILDVYPKPHERKEIALRYQYLKKVSGKHYHPDAIKNILHNLGFELCKEGIDDLKFLVPLHKTDIHIPVDLVEEIMRIDGLDNIDIPSTMNVTLTAAPLMHQEKIKEKVASILSGLGGNEIITNSIVNSKLYTEEENKVAVKMMNNLSAELDAMRLGMKESVLQVIGHNINRKQQDLFLYDFGTTYRVNKEGKFIENQVLCITVTGNMHQPWWQQKAIKWDIFSLKGLVSNVFQSLGLELSFKETPEGLQLTSQGKMVGFIVNVRNQTLKTFDIKQDVFMAEIAWEMIVEMSKTIKVGYVEVSKYPSVERDLSMVIATEKKYQEVQAAIKKANIAHLQQFHLFDIFENEKLGVGKKSMAINFVFSNSEQTFTDKDIDKMIQKIIASLEKEVQAEIRK